MRTYYHSGNNSKAKGPGKYARWHCNLAALWGQTVTGSGHSHLEEAMGVLGVLVMSKAAFIRTEYAIGELWKDKRFGL